MDEFFFKEVSGSATMMAKRLFISKPLADSIGWPWTAGLSAPKAEIFDYNGRPYRSIEHFCADYSLSLAVPLGTRSLEPAPTASSEPKRAESGSESDLLSLFRRAETSFQFTTMESLRRIWRHSLTHPNGPFRLYLSGVITSGKWKPFGRSRAWLPEPFEVEAFPIQCVKTAWIFLEGDFFVQELEPGSTVTVVRTAQP